MTLTFTVLLKTRQKILTLYAPQIEDVEKATAEMMKY